MLLKRKISSRRHCVETSSILQITGVGLKQYRSIHCLMFMLRKRPCGWKRHENTSQVELVCKQHGRGPDKAHVELVRIGGQAQRTPSWRERDSTGMWAAIQRRPNMGNKGHIVGAGKTIAPWRFPAMQLPRHIDPPPLYLY